MIPMGIFLANATSAAPQSRQREAAVQLADSWVEILANSQPPTHSDGAVAVDTTGHPHRPGGHPGPAVDPGGHHLPCKAIYTIAAANEPHGLRPLLVRRAAESQPSRRHRAAGHRVAGTT